MPDIGHWIEYKQKHGKPEWSWSAVNIRDRDRPDLGFLGSSTQLLGVAPLQRWGWIMRLWDRAGQVWSCSSYRSKIYGHNPHPKPGLLLQMFLENKCSFSGFLSAPPTPCSIWRRMSKQLKISVRPSTSPVRISTWSGYDVQILKIFCSDLGWYSGTTPATLLDISSKNCLKHNPE